MKKTATIDVVMPVRGLAPWLTLALESIKRQSLAPDQITIVDDGIECFETIEQFRSAFGDRWRVLKNDGQGVSDALNTAISASNADWIARMDSDDIAHPQRLEKQLAHLQESGQDWVGCGTQVRFINEKNRILGQSNMPVSPELCRSAMAVICCFYHPTMMLSRPLLSKIPYRKLLEPAADLDCWFRLLEAGAMGNLPIPLLDYRMHASQISFRRRPEQTASQELVWRLARARKLTGSDPLDSDPELGKRFVRWRLAQPGYRRARMALTAARYGATFARGGDWRNAAQCLRTGVQSWSLHPAAMRISWRIARHGTHDMVQDSTPFPELNNRGFGTSGKL